LVVAVTPQVRKTGRKGEEIVSPHEKHPEEYFAGALGETRGKCVTLLS
jgi:hypothetical protein